MSVVKHSYLVTDINDIPKIINEAFYLAQSGRPGPVLVDIPKNIQQQLAQPVFSSEVNVPCYDPNPIASDIALNEIIGLIEKSERPVLYVGGGIISAEASEALVQFATTNKIPVTSTIMGIGAFPETHDLSLKWLGMHGSAYANWAVHEADLLLAFGVRFDDRVTGKVEKFCEHGTIVHVDIDPSEIHKNKPANLPIVSNVKYALER